MEQEKETNQLYEKQKPLTASVPESDLHLNAKFLYNGRTKGYLLIPWKLKMQTARFRNTSFSFPIY